MKDVVEEGGDLLLKVLGELVDLLGDLSGFGIEIRKARCGGRVGNV